MISRITLLTITDAADVADRTVTTIEGLGQNGGLHPLQQAFYELGGYQCGYCTPGMIMVSKALLDRNPHPTHAEIADALAGNVCRCTGYQSIFEAIEDAAHRISGHEWSGGRELGGKKQ